MIIPMKDALSSYRLAALRIQELRRMGVPCHIRENADPSGRRYLEVVSETPAGDHAVVVLEVKSTTINHESKPLIYHGASFRQLAA